MALLIRIDRLDANIEEITVGRWLKAVGEPVALEEPVVEIITDKITFEYAAEGEGVLREIVAPERSIVPVHYVIGVVARPGEELPDWDAHNASLLAGVAAGVSVHAAAAVPSVPAERVRATPAARRRARELGIDLGEVARGVDGAVQASDVEEYARRSG